MASIELRNDGGVAVLTINRPEVMNAIDDTTRADMIAALDQVSRDHAIKALVLTGDALR